MICNVYDRFFETLKGLVRISGEMGELHSIAGFAIATWNLGI